MAISPGGRPADASPVGTPGGRQNWVDKAGGLPSYIRMVAHAMIRKGHDESSAIRLAVGIVRNWAEGKGDVSPKVRAAAAKAIAEWEAKRGKAHVDMSTEDGIERGTNTLNPRVDVRDIDLSALATGDTSPVAGSTDVDLAPGDYHPPYDWKHGFIPITPAAVRSKRKLGKKTGRAVPPKGVHIAGIGKVRPGQKRKSSTTPGNAAAFDVPASKKIEHAAIMFGTGSKQHKAAQARFGAQAKAEDDAKRGRAVPGAVAAARPPSATAGKATSSITAGDVIHEPKIIGGGTARLKVDKVYSPDGKTGNRNADVTNMDTGATHEITLDGTKTHQVETTKTGPVVSDAFAAKLKARREMSHQGAVQSGVKAKPDGTFNPTHSERLAQEWPVGQHVTAGVAGNDTRVEGRVVGHTDTGMLRVAYRDRKGDTVTGTFNPSQATKGSAPHANAPGSIADRINQQTQAGMAAGRTAADPPMPRDPAQKPQWEFWKKHGSAAEFTIVKSDGSKFNGKWQIVGTARNGNLVMRDTDHGTTVHAAPSELHQPRATNSADEQKARLEARTRAQTSNAAVAPKSGVSATVLPVGAAGDAYAGRGKIDGTGRLSNGGHHSTPPVVITGANGTEYRRDSGGMWHARKPDGSTYEVANQREAKKLDAERARVHAAHNAGPHPEADAAAAAERDRKRKVAEAMRTAPGVQRDGRGLIVGGKPKESTGGDLPVTPTAEQISGASTSDLENRLRTLEGVNPNSPTATAIKAELARRKGNAPGISESTARKMSDAQLEDAVRRLMASGTYSGPALGVLEDEMNKRDKARAGKAPRR